MGNALKPGSKKRVKGRCPNCFSGVHSKRTANKGAGSEASLPVTKKPSNTVQVTWEATAEGVQRAIGKPSGSYSFYHYNRKVNSGSAKSSLTFYCCRGISRLRARPKGMKTNEVCDRPLETFGAATLWVSCFLCDAEGHLFSMNRRFIE